MYIHTQTSARSDIPGNERRNQSQIYPFSSLPFLAIGNTYCSYYPPADRLAAPNSVVWARLAAVPLSNTGPTTAECSCGQREAARLSGALQAVHERVQRCPLRKRQLSGNGGQRCGADSLSPSVNERRAFGVERPVARGPCGAWLGELPCQRAARRRGSAVHLSPGQASTRPSRPPRTLQISLPTPIISQRNL